jgi:8-oxo-dGTP pyrophosphatase MutT (NUDIX family)
MKKPVLVLGAAGTLILRADGFVLCVQKAADPEAVGFPCGKLERGESPVAAAIRETEEETGLHVSLTIRPNAFTAIDDIGHYVCIYRASSWHGTQKFRTKEGPVSWVKPEQLCTGRYKKFNTACLKHFKLLK